MRLLLLIETILLNNNKQQLNQLIGSDPTLRSLAVSSMSSAARAMLRGWVVFFSGRPLTNMYLSPTVSIYCDKVRFLRYQMYFIVTKFWSCSKKQDGQILHNCHLVVQLYRKKHIHQKVIKIKNC